MAPAAAPAAGGAGGDGAGPTPAPEPLAPEKKSDATPLGGSLLLKLASFHAPLEWV